MNAAFLLVTTAWFAGADAAPATAAAAPAATTPAIVGAPLAGGAPAAGSCCGGGAVGGAYGGGCGGCGCGCEVDCCCKPSCLDKLKARFHKNSCCDCCNTCNTCCNTCNTGCGSSVGCCGGSFSSCGCGACCDTCCSKPGLCARLKARLHKSNCCNTCCDSGCGCDGGCGGCGGYGAGVGGVGGVGGVVAPGTVMPPAGEQLKTLPKDSTNPGNKLPSDKDNNKGQVQSQDVDLTPASSNTIETETKNPFELDRRYETRVGRAADYGWVTGQLFYVHTDGGFWVLRYAPLGKEDNHGGRVILAQGQQMDSYREGDLVKVHGEILNPKGSIFLGGPLYRAQSIELIDRNAR